MKISDRVPVTRVTVALKPICTDPIVILLLDTTNILYNTLANILTSQNGRAQISFNCTIFLPCETLYI